MAARSSGDPTASARRRPPRRLRFGDHLLLAPFMARGDLVGMMMEARRRFGDAIDLGYGARRMILLFGTDANRHILHDASDAFVWGPAMRALVAVDGPTALVVSDGDDHRRRRRLVQPAFAVKRVDAHLGLVTAQIDQALAEWQVGNRFDAAPSIEAAIRRIVVRALFGEQLGALADRFGDLLEPALRYVQRIPQLRFDHDLKINAYARAQRHPREADALVMAEVSRRRAAGPLSAADADEHPDVLTALLADVEGDTLTDPELLDQVRSLMAAGFHTTAAAAAWLTLELGRNPDVLSALAAEVDDVLDGRPPTLDDLRALPLCAGVVHEVLRMWPPGPAAPRWSVASTTVGDSDVEIPADRLVLYSAYATGRDPEVWPDPERFDPTRWLPGAPEPPPYAVVPFGGGQRRCIGFALATLELHVLAIRLAQQFEWRYRGRRVQATGIASLTPKGGVPIEVTARR